MSPQSRGRAGTGGGGDGGLRGPPRLTRPDYYTEPRLEQLAAMRNEELRRVKDFTVGRRGVGQVTWPGEVDVRGLDLDSVVFFEPKEVIVYPDETRKPPLGQGLNRPALVLLERCFPVDRTGRPVTDPQRLRRYAEKIRRRTADLGAHFISYDPATGNWRFRVEHFSKYGIRDDEDEEEEGDEEEEEEEEKQQQQQGPAVGEQGSRRRQPQQRRPDRAPAQKKTRPVPLRSSAAQAPQVPPVSLRRFRPLLHPLHPHAHTHSHTPFSAALFACLLPPSSARIAITTSDFPT